MKSEQLDLLSADAATPPFPLDAVEGKATSYTLFFALIPSTECAQRIALAAAVLRNRHGLKGKCLDAPRPHLTLHTVAHFRAAVDQDLVDAACAAAARVRCTAPSIVFDQALTFAASDAFVLRCDADSDAAIKHLRQMLTVELRRCGLHAKATETPHLTLLYDKRKIDKHPMEPVLWTASRLALILSHVGASHHQHVADRSLLNA